jgi:hypothetical protein
MDELHDLQHVFTDERDDERCDPWLVDFDDGLQRSLPNISVVVPRIETVEHPPATLGDAREARGVGFGVIDAVGDSQRFAAEEHPPNVVGGRRDPRGRKDLHQLIDF